MLDVEVVPEFSLCHRKWELILGMPIQQTIDILKKQENEIKSVEFWYSDKVPFHMDLVLCLPQDGIKLYFDAYEQRLKIIEVYDMSKIRLKYYQTYFNSPSVKPSLEEIDRTFGATRPPQPDPDTGNQLLTFRGLSFLLTPLSSGISSFQALRHQPGVTRSVPLCVTKMSIYSGSSLTDTKVPVSLPPKCFHGNLFLEKLVVVRENDEVKELVCHLVAQNLSKTRNAEHTLTRFTRILTFGNSVQDVVSAIGSSSRVYYKAEDKMKIHSPQAHRLIQTPDADYFYNYISLGIDVLFEARSHRVKKFVLHTNLPGHCNFNSYYRCFFEIPIPRSNTASSQSPFVVNAFIKWNQIELILGKENVSEPVIMNQSAGGSVHNPFGPTYCYGFKDIIFEVIPSNDHIASVTLYKADSNFLKLQQK